MGSRLSEIKNIKELGQYVKELPFLAYEETFAEKNHLDEVVSDGYVPRLSQYIGMSFFASDGISLTEFYGGLNSFYESLKDTKIVVSVSFKSVNVALNKGAPLL